MFPHDLAAWHFIGVALRWPFPPYVCVCFHQEMKFLPNVRGKKTDAFERARSSDHSKIAEERKNSPDIAIWQWTGAGYKVWRCSLSWRLGVAGKLSKQRNLSIEYLILIPNRLRIYIKKRREGVNVIVAFTKLSVKLVLKYVSTLYTYISTLTLQKCKREIESMLRENPDFHENVYFLIEANFKKEIESIIYRS